MILNDNLVVYGNAYVGKTCLINQLNSDTKCSKQYKMTTFCDLVMKSVKLPCETTVNLFIHDVGGNDVFEEYFPTFCKHAQSFLIVYDVTDKDSFDSASKWIKMAIHHMSCKNAIGVLVANKIDLPARTVSTDKGAEFAKSHNLMYFECSAVHIKLTKANAENVEAPFNYIAQKFNERYREYAELVKNSIN